MFSSNSIVAITGHDVNTTSLHAGKCFMICLVICWLIFKIIIFENFIQEYHHGVKQFGSRTGLTFCLRIGSPGARTVQAPEIDRNGHYH